MPKRTSCLLALVLLCGVGQAGVSVADSTRFIGHMPKGTVELVAVTFWPPTKQSQWWQPDGLLTSIGPFLPQNPKPMPPAGPHLRQRGLGAKALVCLVRCENIPADASSPLGGFNSDTTWPWRTVMTGLGWPWSASLDGNYVIHHAQGPRPSRTRVYGRSPLIGGSPSWYAANKTSLADGRGGPARNQARSSQLAATDRAYPYADGKVGREYYQMFYVNFLASAPMTDLRVGISMGTWETVLTEKPESARREVFNSDGEQWTVIFQKQRVTGRKAPGKTLVRHTVPVGRFAMRLVTVADDGTEDAFVVGRHWDNRISVTHRPRSSIQEFRLQVRPYHWVEFQGISLQPGQKTRVTVVPLDAP